MKEDADRGGPPRGPFFKMDRTRGALLAALAIVVQALLAQLTASLVFNLIALVILAPWALLLLVDSHPSSTASWTVTGVTVALLMGVLGVVWLSGGDGGSEPTYISKPGNDGDPLRFEMTGSTLTVSGLPSEVWGDTVLIACMTRAGSYTYDDRRWVVEDVGNVATAEAEWPSGDQALTVAFAAPLKSPPAYCALEGSEGDIGAAVFCDTGDDTEIPGAKGGPNGLEVGPDGKLAILVDEACAGEEEI